MKSLLVNIKNLLPYLLLIVVYFFFVNLEAQNSNTNNKMFNINEDINDNKSNIKKTNKRISIPVIPYSQ